MDHRTSVLHAVCEKKAPERLLLENLKPGDIPYALARDMRRERYTDYIAVPLGSDGSHELILTMATQRPGGFLLWELAALNRLVDTMVPTILACVGHEGRQWGWRDPLTALSNRGSFEQQLSQQIALSRVTGDPFSLVILDLDDFGAYNDTFGHFCADSLQSIARLLTRRLGADNPLLARVGADAFAILLPSVTGVETERLAAELVAEIQGLRIAHPAALDPFMSASVGIETHWPLLEPEDAQATEVLARAEIALNRARHTKRSCQLMPQ
jgi:diguanylate cyclase (GGDEF)-like protein